MRASLNANYRYVLVPGLHNSGHAHWQSIWEKTYPDLCIRVQQEDWDAPQRNNWVESLEKQLAPIDKSHCILIGHSMGCITIIHWLLQYKHKIRGALLVAPSDADKPGFPAYIDGFSPIPLEKLSCSSIVVASDNDHVTSLQHAHLFAEHWGSELVTLKQAGHIEDESGFGPWREGLELVNKLSSGAE